MLVCNVAFHLCVCWRVHQSARDLVCTRSRAIVFLGAQFYPFRRPKAKLRRCLRSLRMLGVVLPRAWLVAGLFEMNYIPILPIILPKAKLHRPQVLSVHRVLQVVCARSWEVVLNLDVNAVDFAVQRVLAPLDRPRRDGVGMGTGFVLGVFRRLPGSLLGPKPMRRRLLFATHYLVSGVILARRLCERRHYLKSLILPPHLTPKLPLSLTLHH